MSDRLAEIKAISGAGRRKDDAMESVLISNSALDWLIDEVERLRGLVEEAYEEGTLAAESNAWIQSHGGPPDPSLTWAQSKSRTALEAKP